MIPLDIVIDSDHLLDDLSFSNYCRDAFRWFADSFRFRDLLSYASLTVISEITMFSVFITYMRQSFVTDETSATVSIIANQLLYVVYTAPFGISYKFGKSSSSRARPHVRDTQGEKQYGNYLQLLISFAFRWFFTSLIDMALVAITWVAASSLFDGDVKDHISEMVYSGLKSFTLFAYLFFHSTSALLTLTKHYKTQAFACIAQATSAYLSRDLYFPDDLTRTSADYAKYPNWVSFVSVVYGVVGLTSFVLINRKKFQCISRLKDLCEALRDGWSDFFKDGRGIFKSVLADTFLIKFIGYVVVFGLLLSEQNFAELSVFNLYQLFLLLVVGLSLQIGLTQSIHHVNFDEGELFDLKRRIEGAVREQSDVQISLLMGGSSEERVILEAPETKCEVGDDTFKAEAPQARVRIPLSKAAIDQGLLQYRQKRNAAILILSMATFLQFFILPIGDVKNFVADQYSEAGHRTSLQTDNFHISLNTLLTYFWCLNNIFEGAGNGLKKKQQKFSRINNVTNGLLVGLSAFIFSLFDVNNVAAYLWVFFGTALLSALWGGHTLFTSDKNPGQSDGELMQVLVGDALDFFAKGQRDKVRKELSTVVVSGSARGDVLESNLAV